MISKFELSFLNFLNSKRAELLPLQISKKLLVLAQSNCEKIIQGHDIIEKIITETCVLNELGLNISVDKEYLINEELVTKVIWDEIRNAKININNRDMNKIGFAIHITQNRKIVSYFYFVFSPTNIDDLIKRRQVSPKRIPVSPMRKETLQYLHTKSGFNTPRQSKILLDFADDDDGLDTISSIPDSQPLKTLSIQPTPTKPTLSLSIVNNTPKKIPDFSQFQDDDDEDDFL